MSGGSSGGIVDYLHSYRDLSIEIEELAKLLEPMITRPDTPGTLQKILLQTEQLNLIRNKLRHINTLTKD